MYVYGIFFQLDGRARVATSTNRREALTFARANAGAVGRISRALYRAGGLYGWDAPTFKAQADFIADYRTGATHATR